MLRAATQANVQIASTLRGNTSAKNGEITIAPPPEKTFTRQSSVEGTAAFLRQEGFEDYAGHFFAKRMNGRALLQVDSSHLAEMPEQSRIMQLGFLSLIEELKEAETAQRSALT
jgi:hypothetical protein